MRGRSRALCDSSSLSAKGASGLTDRRNGDLAPIFGCWAARPFPSAGCPGAACGAERAESIGCLLT